MKTSAKPPAAGQSNSSGTGIAYRSWTVASSAWPPPPTGTRVDRTGGVSRVRTSSMTSRSLFALPPIWREGRLGIEAASLFRDPIHRGHGVADADGQPVLLIPGFLAGDDSLGIMTRW